jgi:uroporphyrinogen-III synthase
MPSLKFGLKSAILTGSLHLMLPFSACLVQPLSVSSRQPTSLAATMDRTVVALTREDGKNGKLIKRIQENSDLNEKVELVELPCIEHASGPDFEQLGATLTSARWDYVAVTSPEAAKVLASAWADYAVKEDDPLHPAVCAVGKATEKALEGYGIPVAFVPSKATAATLAAELELKEGGEETTLLYPASAQAKDTLQNDLEARGFKVTRLNTYNTVTANWTEDQKKAAARAKIACFASPSSIKGWLKNTEDNNEVIAACIGETSAKACRGHEWKESNIFYPDSPGLEAWVDTIQEAVDDIKISHA